MFTSSIIKIKSLLYTPKTSQQTSNLIQQVLVIWLKFYSRGIQEELHPLLLLSLVINCSFLKINQKDISVQLAATHTHTHAQSSEWDGEDKGWPPRPLLGAHSRLDTQLRAEADQLAWACRGGGREGRGGQKERSPQFQIIPSYSAGWLTSFPTKAGEKNRGRGESLTEACGGRRRRRRWMGTGQRLRWQSTVPTHIWRSHRTSSIHKKDVLLKKLQNKTYSNKRTNQTSRMKLWFSFHFHSLGQKKKKYYSNSKMSVCVS